MQFKSILSFDRGVSEISALVCAEIRVNENKRFELTEFMSDTDLRPTEIEIAHETLIERARSYPDSGEETRPSFRLEEFPLV
jgi:hypothetical protein